MNFVYFIHLSIHLFLHLLKSFIECPQYLKALVLLQKHQAAGVFETRWGLRRAL